MSDDLLPYLSPSTLLQATNLCLRAVGEAPVSTLVGGGASVDVEAAFQAIQEVNRAVQAEGWSFNTETDYPLVPDNSGHLILPDNTLKAVPSGTTRSLDLVMRGGKLYDRANHTFVFKDTVYVTLTVLLEFEDLPELARNYIAIRAARRFADDQLTSTDIHRVKLEDEERARMMLEQGEAVEDHTSLAGSPHFWINWQRGRRGRTFGN